MKSSFSSEEFLEAITKQIKTLQVLAFGFVSSILAFSTLVIFLGVFQAPAQPIPQGNTHSLSQLQLFSLVNLVMLSSCFMMAFLLPKATAQRKLEALRQYQSKEPLYQNAIQIFQFGFILKMALLEGPGLFGLVICFLGAQSGILQTTPILWLNTLPAVLFVLIWAISFPSKSKLQQWFELQLRPVLEESNV